ncbi:formate dehydrogenase subunit gamma [Paracoccus aestuarii]|uniref:Formate dehydrogenase subunit gamma n=1 Tax=Paracoccus aestuarii TaxID=453842 RepID=A0A418ZYM5_9RHOB|nr:formate dehydrogenase subunit gamma [Paracoccus aestuarii]RJL05632.1 formate dehydrogenase subunit gamma [Paracoccus aestuarii]WCQ97920.1 formate dehydrogenase subunit gamma [Paracoccus aestuarii]
MRDAAPASDIDPRDIRDLVTPLAGLEGPLLPMLHAIQEEWGHVPAAAVPVLADILNLGRAEVLGVISFYHDFRDHPAGRQVLKICRAEACQAMGGAGMAAETLVRLGVDWHGTTPDGAVTVEPVYCLGLCACAPAAMIGDRVIGRVTPERLVRELGA